MKSDEFKVGGKAMFINSVVIIESINSCGVAFVHHENNKVIQFHVKISDLELI